MLPEDKFAVDMKDIVHLTNPDDYLDLKKKWKTSLQVLGYRATQLGLMEPRNHRNFYAAMHRKKYLEREPLDKIIPIQKPMKVKSIIDLVSKRGLVDIRQMIEDDWKAEVAFFHQMTGIDPGFFNRYMTRNLDFGIQNVTNIHEHMSTDDM